MAGCPLLLKYATGSTWCIHPPVETSEGTRVCRVASLANGCDRHAQTETVVNSTQRNAADEIHY